MPLLTNDWESYNEKIETLNEVSDETKWLINQLTEEQKQIFTTIYTDILNNQFMCISGIAGCGKSFIFRVLEQFFTDLQIDVLKMAPTGIAAQNIGGSTIDSAMIRKTNVNESNYIRSLLRKRFDKVEKTPETIYKFIFDCLERKSFAIESDFVLLIDEAFMIDCVTLSKLFFFFGECKIIFFGDPYQLPPVMNYSGFSLPNFCPMFNIKCFEIFNIVRTDYPFLKNLYVFLRNSIKNKTSFSKLSIETREQFTFFSEKNNNDKFMAIDGHKSYVCVSNDECNKINKSVLSTIDGPFVSFNVRAIKGKCSFLAKILKDNMFNSEFRFYPILETKVGARIMFTKNSSNYKNGTLGTILSIQNDDCIIVEIDGLEQEISRCEFKCEKYSFTYYQFAFINAYALTFHKMQGLTISHPIMVQSNSRVDMRKMYVFFSRVKNPNQIYFNNPFTQEFFPGCFKKTEHGSDVLEGLSEFLKNEGYIE